MEKIHENMCFDVVFLYENIRTCLFTYVSPFSAHFYPPLHHNGKGSIPNQLIILRLSSRIVAGGGAYGCCLYSPPGNLDAMRLLLGPRKLAANKPLSI